MPRRFTSSQRTTTFARVATSGLPTRNGRACGKPTGSSNRRIARKGSRKTSALATDGSKVAHSYQYKPSYTKAHWAPKPCKHFQILPALRARMTLARNWLRNSLIRNSWSNRRSGHRTKNFYAYALDPNGQRIETASVLATVPLWFGLLDEDKAGQTLDQLADADQQTDWGMRIISSQNPLYNPDGYHYGSVWPLFTGWAAVGEYRYHHARPPMRTCAQTRCWHSMEHWATSPKFSPAIFISLYRPALRTRYGPPLWSSAHCCAGCWPGS